LQDQIKNTETNLPDVKIKSDPDTKKKINDANGEDNEDLQSDDIENDNKELINRKFNH